MKSLENKKYWVWLSLVNNIGSKIKQRLLEKYQNPELIYNATREELLQIQGIGEVLVEKILDYKIREEIKKHIEYMKNHNIDIISINDEEYPKLLKEIYDPPISLYIKGDKSILNQQSIAIVGCREASEYGKKAAKYFAYNLANENINVVSGLAKGIDSYAHEATLYTKGKTIEVLGN